MARRSTITIFALIKWFKNYYVSLEKDVLPFPCKLVGFTQKNGETFVKIEFSGQINTIEIEIKKIIKENLFEHFSPQDKKLMFQAFYKNEEQFQLTDHYYCRETKAEMVILTETLTGNKLTLPASAISDSNKFDEQVTKKDLKRISYISGVEYIKKIFGGFKK